MRVVLCAVVLVLGMLVTTPVTAQSSEAPPLGPETNVLYLHSETGEDMWMNALEVDGAAGTICYTAPTPTQIGDLCPNPGEAFEYVFDVTPALAQDLLLDADGTVDFEIYWGGACCTAGRATYDLTLTSGDVTVASTSGTHIMNPGAISSVCPNDGCVYNALTASLTPAVDRIAAADGLTLSLTGSGAWTHAAISTLEDRGASKVVLPIIGTSGGADGAGPNITFVDLDAPELDASYENATTSVAQYNWTSPSEGAPALHVTADVQNGSLAVEIITSEAAAGADGANGTAADNGTTVFSWNGTGSLNETVQIPACGGPDAPAPCAVAFRFSLGGFVGSYAVTALPSESTDAGNGTAEPGADEGPDKNGTSDLDGAGNGTSDLDGAGNGTADQESPLPILAPLVGVAAALWARRRI